MWIQVLILCTTQRLASRANDPFEPKLKSPMPPEPLLPHWGPWKFSRHRRHFIHMTAELVKDVTYKLHLSERYVEMHKGAINYELGFIAAAIHERFRNMIYLYRKYSRPLLNKTYNPFKQTELDNELEDIVKALNLAHGDYNQILYERKTFYKLLREHEEKKGNTISMFDRNKRKGRRSFPNVSDILTMVPEGARNMENLEETTESMKNKRLTDEEYKRRLRWLKYEERRANFTPEIEGIDIDLDYF